MFSSVGDIMVDNSRGTPRARRLAGSILVLVMVILLAACGQPFTGTDDPGLQQVDWVINGWSIVTVPQGRALASGQEIELQAIKYYDIIDSESVVRVTVRGEEE